MSCALESCRLLEFKGFQPLLAGNATNPHHTPKACSHAPASALTHQLLRSLLLTICYSASPCCSSPFTYMGIGATSTQPDFHWTTAFPQTASTQLCWTLILPTTNGCAKSTLIMVRQCHNDTYNTSMYDNVIYPVGNKLEESTELLIFVSTTYYWFPFWYFCLWFSQNAGHIESHTFATSTLTQFCILFKRTLITICRDQVGDVPE